MADLIDNLIISSSTTAEDNCDKFFRYLDCIRDKVLVGYQIKTILMPVPALQICQNKCFHEEQCVSYNLGPVDGAIRTCELNSADHWMNASALVPKNGFEYCPIEVTKVKVNLYCTFLDQI